MCHPASGDTMHREVADRIVSAVVAVAVLAVVFTWAAGPLHAQTVPTTQRDSDSQSARVTPSLEGVPGVEADMTPDELLELARVAVEEGRLGDGRKIMLALVARDRTNLAAMSYLAFAYERSAEEIRGDGRQSQVVWRWPNPGGEHRCGVGLAPTAESLQCLQSDIDAPLSAAVRHRCNTR